MADTTSTTLTTAIETSVLEEEGLAFLYATTVCLPHCLYKDISGSDTLTDAWWTKPQFTAADLTEGDSLTAQAVTTGSGSRSVGVVGLAVDITKYGASASKYSVEEIARDMAEPITQRIDTDITGLFAALNGGGIAGATGQNMTVAYHLQAKYMLNINKATQLGSYVSIYDEEQRYRLESDLIALTGTVLTGREPSNLNLAANGYAGTLFQVPIYATTNVQPPAGTSTDNVGVMMVDKEAIVFVNKWKPELWTDKNVLKISTVMSYHTCYGVGERRDAAGVPVQTA